ncbi:MAG: N-acetyltransferase [Proteobacteria bacterium]|nr:N-acetyltransferase [Pseudomonadota bacterium]
MQPQILTTLKNIKPSQWNQLVSGDFPFSGYDYLRALEDGESVGKETGWDPQYLTLWEGEELVAATPLYLKNNSYGEYIFDWGWADAYHSHGMDYYPKLVSSIPFTPATGNKLLIHRKINAEEARLNLIQHSLDLTRKNNCSSLHYLFISKDEIPSFSKSGLDIRHSFQFHWKNEGYKDFNEFLDLLKGKRRKEILRERRSIKEQNIEIHHFTGDQIQAEQIQRIYNFYLSTTYKKGAIDYLTGRFYDKVYRSMKDQMLIILAKLEGRWIAGTINYFKGKNLYGRYWGCSEERKNLHFELCYYQPIEFAIKNNITLFEAGAQGGHKLQRGFLPELTYSAHWIEHPAFRKGVSNFIEEEKASIQHSFAQTRAHWPYKSPS